MPLNPYELARKNEDRLRALGVPFGTLELTSNMVEHQIFDAVAQFRDFLTSNQIHDYESQAFGGDVTTLKRATFIDADGDLFDFEVSFYRAAGRGDRRLSFRRLRTAIVPVGRVALVWLDDQFWVFSLSQLDLPTLARSQPRLREIVVRSSREPSQIEIELIEPELDDAWLLADQAAGRPTPGRTLQLNPFVRKAIERRAVGVVTDYLVGLGYEVLDVGATESYDLDARRDDAHIFVEVKGTTSSGGRVILTRNEVKLHTARHPNNMLAIVSSIVIDRSEGRVTATGGDLRIITPWLVENERLEAISYEYSVPEDEALEGDD